MQDARHTSGAFRDVKAFPGRRDVATVLAFDAAGHGPDPAIVVLHGWPLNRSIWSEIGPRIAAPGYRVLVPDLPGCGDSPTIEFARATVEAYADELARFLDAFGPRRFAIAGHSFGGYVALALAERRPDLVAALGLVASRTTADSEAARAGRRETIGKVRASGTSVLLPGLAEKLVGPAAAPQWRERATLLIQRARPDGVASGLAAMAARPDRTAMFESFPGPRLVVHGTADALIAVSEAAPAPIRAILPDVGHMPMWEAPEATAVAILAWAKSILA